MLTQIPLALILINIVIGAPSTHLMSTSKILTDTTTLTADIIKPKSVQNDLTSNDLQRAKRLTTFGNTVPETGKKGGGKGRECRSESDCEAIQSANCRSDPKEPTKRRCICQDDEYPKHGRCTAQSRVKRGYVPILGKRDPNSGTVLPTLFWPVLNPETSSRVPFFPLDTDLTTIPTFRTNNNNTENREKVPRLFRPMRFGSIQLGLRQQCNADSECLEGAECRVNPNATTPAQQRIKICLCSPGRVEMHDACSSSSMLQIEFLLIFLIFLSAVYNNN